MEKENGETGGGDGSKANDASSLLDAASLFNAYWGRDPSALLGSYGAGAASFNLLGAAAAAAAAAGGGGGGGSSGASGGGNAGGGGGSGGRYPPSSTLSVAASQAASLGLHPAASAAWWSMASQLAAQDYLARLQASGLGGFPPGADPYSLAAVAGLAQAQSRGGSSASTSGSGQGTRGRPPGGSRGPHNRTSHSTAVKDNKDKSSLRSTYGLPKTSSPSMSSMSSMQGLSALGLNSMAGSRTPTLPSHSPQPSHSSSSSSKHSRKSSAAAKASALSGAYLGGVSSKGGSSNNAGGGGASNTASSPSPSSSSTKEKDLSSMMRSDLLMAQAAMAQNAYQAAVAQQQGKSVKNSSSLFGNTFGFGSLGSSSLSSEKDRQSSGLDSLANLPHTILSAALEGSDGASILGGVRLPPDTEIIKYTSSIVGPKVPGTTNRGRKKTISLDPPQVSVHPALSSTGLLVERGGPAKRPKLESEYGNTHAAHQSSSLSTLSGGSSSDRVEVIKLPSGSADPRSSKSSFDMNSYTGLSKELLQSIANQSGLNLAALEKQFAQQFGSSSNYSKSSSYSSNQDFGLNLSAKSSQSLSQPQRDESPASTANDEDAPLNLSLKPSSSKSSNDDWKNSSSTSSSRLPDEASSSLNSLSNITASLAARAQQQSTSLDRVSRRKPGAKPRRVIQESSPSPSHLPGQESPTPSGSEDSDMGPWHPTKEGRPRNLGRGVSKPKKNTVASLLAQSRALGIRPSLAQQYLQEAADLLNPELQEKLKAAMSDMSAGLIPPPELSGTDSDGGPLGSDSCADDSDASDVLAAEPMLRLPLAMGWRRETLMKGLSRNGSIKGDVTYYPPEPRSNIKLKNIAELMNFLEKNPCPPLQKENFSFSSKPLIGRFLQANGQEGMSETEVAKRLEEARRALSSAGTTALGVEQRIELARQQQAAREARKDAAKGREQARMVREQERNEKVEQAKREKEVRNQQLLEAQIKQANESLKILNANEQNTIGFWKSIQAIASSSSIGSKQISVSMPSMSLTLTPVPSLTISPVTAVTNMTHSQWRDDYNALDRIKNFAESAALTFTPSKSKQEVKKDFKLIPVKQETKSKNNSMTFTRIKQEKDKPDEEQNRIMLTKITNAYSRMSEYLSGKCAWAKNTPSQKKVKSSKLDDFKDIENRYLRAKNDYMCDILTLLPSEDVDIKSVFETLKVVEVIDLVDNEEEEMPKAVQEALLRKKAYDDALTAKRKRQEDLERQKQEDLTRKQQEREMKRQQTVMLKEQMYMAEVGKQRELIYTVELERERRRQHMALVKQLENRRRYEEREKRKNRMVLDKLAIKEKKLEQRKKELELLKELRKPQEDSTLSDQKSLPTLNRIPGLKLPGQAMADILMVFEFIHNFGQTLGFDMDTLPSLNTLQMALLPDCCSEAEEELLSILIHLLVCAIEDPGIPHPGRHTTILGHTLKVNEVTPANVSEVLRIYLYANATGEIRSLTGINPERDRERRVADHHQSDMEVQQQALGRNSTYYTHLHNNLTWRLAEKLRHHPYLALNPTSKSRILAILCDELLQSKAVLRQIDQSLESLSQLRKDRYMMDIKLRKLKMVHSRKARMEAIEKQQALALERMQKMVEESEMNVANAQATPTSTGDNQDVPALEQQSGADEKVDVAVGSDAGLGEEKKLDEPVANHDDTSDMDVVVMGAPPLKEEPPLQPQQIVVKGANHSIKEDKDSVMGDSEIILSDVESEGTQPEEDEDKNLSAEELSRKLEKLIRQSDAQLQSLISGTHSIRATCYGQDRYWRRYWSLSKSGGIFVEAMESTQPEIIAYHERMEENAKKREEGEAATRLANKKTRGKKGPKPKVGTENDIVEAAIKNTEQQLQNELELRNIKSELNLSDHTRIIKYEPNMGHKVQGSPIKMEEKHIQQQKVAEDHLLDIEDSIPTAFLVQKPQNNETRKPPPYPLQPGADSDKVETSLKNENTDIKVESSIKNEQENSQNSSDSIKVEKKEGAYLNNLEELKRLADSVVPVKENSQSEVKQEMNCNESIKEEKTDIKNEVNDVETAITYLANKMNDGKWFSILRKENPLSETSPIGVQQQPQPQVQQQQQQQQTNGVDEKDPNIVKNATTETQNNPILNSITNLINSKPQFVDHTYTCSEVNTVQGNKWDVCNNLHLLANPAILFTGNDMQFQFHSNMNSFHNPDCTMTMSGLDEDMIDISLNPKQENLNETGETTLENGIKDVTMNHVDEQMDQSINNTAMDTSDTNSVCDKSPSKNVVMNKSKIGSINNTSSNGSLNFSMGGNNSLGGVNVSALTAYVTCDSPPPLQMSPDESEQLEYCKSNGLPKRLEGNYVSKDLRYGWWRITDTDQLKELLSKLHHRGVREKDLYNNFMTGLLQTNNKIQIEKGDLLATELSISHLDRVIALNGGFPSPDSTSSFSVKTARRIDSALLEQIEALEERVAAASMQVKGWKPPPPTTPASTPPHCEEQTTVAACRARLLALEGAIERRYLRPPLGAAPPCPPANANSNTNSNSSNAVSDQDNKDEDSQAQREVTPEPKGPTSIPRGLSVWREGTSRCQTSAQLAMVLHTLEMAVAWDKSIMKANCQFCQSGDNEDKLLLCDGCDKGYHTYCFKPKMDKIPDGDWYCFECLNKATGDRVCIVCGGKSGCPPPGSTRGGRLVHCALCPRAYHQDCHYPPLNKVPRSKWYCVKCIVKAPPKKPRNTKKSRTSAGGDSFSDSMQPPSPAHSQASNTTNDECTITSALMSQSSLSSVQSTPEKHFQQSTPSSEPNKQHFSPVNNFNSLTNDALNDTLEFVENVKFYIAEESIKSNDQNNVHEDTEEFADTENNVADKKQCGSKMAPTGNGDEAIIDGEVPCGVAENDSNSGHNSEEYNSKSESSDRERESRHAKKDRNPLKRMNKELAHCKALLEEMELHDDSWPFLLPVNTKQFPTYKKIIRSPMDLSTIKKKLQEMGYKSKEEFACDVRQIFHNCEVFNEDESPVGRAGHGMRRFFEDKWANVV